MSLTFNGYAIFYGGAHPREVFDAPWENPGRTPPHGQGALDAAIIRTSTSRIRPKSIVPNKMLAFSLKRAAEKPRNDIKYD